MKTMVYIFFSFFMFCAMNLNAQSPIEIDTVSLRYVNGFTNQHEIVDEYRMTNHSNEEYITWVSLEPTNDKSNIELSSSRIALCKACQIVLKNALEVIGVSAPTRM